MPQRKREGSGARQSEPQTLEQPAWVDSPLQPSQRHRVTMGSTFSGTLDPDNSSREFSEEYTRGCVLMPPLCLDQSNL